MALCTRDDVKSYMGSESAINNDLLDDLVDNVSAIIESYCSRTFASAEYTEYYDGYGDTLYTKQYPIITISGVYDDTTWGFGSSTLISSDNYKISDGGLYIQLYPGYTFTYGNQNVKVIYTAGYTTTPVDLKQVCVEEVVRKYKRRNKLDITAVSLPDGTMNLMSDDFLPQSKIVLNRYKRLSLC